MVCHYSFPSYLLKSKDKILEKIKIYQTQKYLTLFLRRNYEQFDHLFLPQKRRYTYTAFFSQSNQCTQILFLHNRSNTHNLVAGVAIAVIHKVKAEMIIKYIRVINCVTHKQLSQTGN